MPGLERLVPPDPYDFLPPVPSFDVRSDDIADGEPMADTFAKAGGNTSPHLAWSGAPAATQSFVVTCFDPDAPIPSGFWHWVAIDLPSTVDALRRGAGANDETLPGGLHVAADSSVRSYSGAAPPPGDRPHRYCFVVHAVDIPRLGLTPDRTPAVVGFTLAFHTLARAKITPTYRIEA